MTDVITSPYINLIAYNLNEGVSCNKISDTLKIVFNEKVKESHIRSFKDTFFKDYECIRGKSFVFETDNKILEQSLPFNPNDVFKNILNAILLKLGIKINNDLNNNLDLKAVDTQFLMNLVKQDTLTQVLTGPSLEDYVSPELEDKIFEWVDSDE